MQESDDEERALTPEESWRAIHTTMDSARSSMYVAGAATIALLWGGIAALGYLSQYALQTFAPDVMTSSPWINLPLWGALVTAGMVASAIIGYRAGRENVTGDAGRSAGIRVFLFWLAVVAAAFLIPAAAGMWSPDNAGANIARASIGIIALGYILFGIMHRPVIAVVGVGIAAAFYVPSYLDIDAAALVSAVLTLIVAALAAAWIRKTGVP